MIHFTDTKYRDAVIGLEALHGAFQEEFVRFVEAAKRDQPNSAANDFIVPIFEHMRDLNINLELMRSEVEARLKGGFDGKQETPAQESMSR